MVGLVLKIKTGFRGFETEQNQGFRKCRDMVKNFKREYMSYIVKRKYAFARYFEVYICTLLF